MYNFSHGVAVAASMLLLSLVFASPPTSPHPKGLFTKRSSITAPHQGKGTNWGGNWKGGNCVFAYWDQPARYPEIAMGGDNWDDGLYCGACIEVQSGPNPPVVGIVGDKCPSCERESLDLDPEMWRRVSGGASPSIIPIKWKVVPCQFNKLPMLLVKKEGMSQWWFAVQVAQSGQPVLSLKYRPVGTQAWQNTKRDTNSNYFMSAGGIPAGKAADIKVCCADGKTEIITPNVDLSGPGVVHAHGNCPPSL
ncbi:Non-catalytic module family EXPN [Melampsora larici-populina 98AG31]|uniref:Non-catalytic module family EXPN n=1 Tax=Melampsora larici-populina (strain 98AG31 / pathotype 3-4-7) TaxID=747676 RepID=F4RVM8_MELLP|nr:Non-catalytic module family EXPN [Melampsora larici-populina 98AG31]EGG03383.1 Non-catalytic module family EXPN [Melampsora larici-populina 98AG31]